MFDDLAALFHENVLSSYFNYVERRDANLSGRSLLLKSAMDAAVALSHFREHLPTSIERSWKEVVAACPAYHLVSDVSNATKHGTLDQSRGARLVNAASDIQEVLIVTMYEDEEGPYTDVRNIVTAICSNGKVLNLDGPLTDTLNFWGEYLASHGVCKFSRRSHAPRPGAFYISRAEAQQPAFEINNAVRWRGNIRLLRFDPKSGVAKLVRFKK